MHYMNHVITVHEIAEEKDIMQLKNRTLIELHRLLCVFDITPDSVPDLLKAIDYAYKHTSKLSQRREPLRELLSQSYLMHGDHVILVMHHAAEDGSSRSAVGMPAWNVYIGIEVTDGHWRSRPKSATTT
jgi:hypothetical protein